MTERLGGQQDEVAVVTSITAALADAVQARDMEQGKVEDLRAELDNLELQRNLNAQRQDRMLNQLEDALTVSMVPLSNMFDAAGLDVDSLLANVRQNYSGTGGLSDEQADALPEFDSRIQGIMVQLDELASLNAAAARIPLVNPVHSGYRLSSPFGPRGGRLHKGLDMASNLNTPIYAAADATVKFSGTQSGYGNVVILDHGGGYETYYAHLNRRLVTVGETISRGDRIALMGNTGRSTGVHLHYEIRKDGVAVNPMTYIKAGRNVY
jgi:murein DD-endopeptidase MepM/ murein hydrolase activator NlpD